MKGDTRCVDGRLMRHDPQFDDPELETDIGQCPACDGEGCERATAVPIEEEDCFPLEASKLPLGWSRTHDGVEFYSAPNHPPLRDRVWRWLGFRTYAPWVDLPDEIEGMAAGSFDTVTTILLDWRDRLRLLLSGRLEVRTFSKTDRPVGKSRTLSSAAVLPPSRGTPRGNLWDSRA